MPARDPRGRTGKPAPLETDEEFLDGLSPDTRIIDDEPPPRA